MKWLLIFLLIPSVVYCQYREHKAGVKLGANFSDIGGGELEKPFTGFHTGVFINGVINPRLQIGSEIFYTLQGVNVEPKIQSDFDIRINLVSANVMCRTFIIPKLQVHAGVQLGFVTKQKIDGEDVSPVYTADDFSLLAGLGYSMDDFEFIIRYSGGLSEVKNRVVQLSVAYSVFKF